VRRSSSVCRSDAKVRTVRNFWDTPLGIDQLARDRAPRLKSLTDRPHAKRISGRRAEDQTIPPRTVVESHCAQLAWYDRPDCPAVEVRGCPSRSARKPSPQRKRKEQRLCGRGPAITTRLAGVTILRAQWRRFPALLESFLGVPRTRNDATLNVLAEIMPVTLVAKCHQSALPYRCPRARRTSRNGRGKGHRGGTCRHNSQFDRSRTPTLDTSGRRQVNPTPPVERVGGVEDSKLRTCLVKTVRRMS